MIEIQIAAASVRDLIPTDKPLEERIRFAMSYVKQHPDLFWMSHQVNDDLKFRTALAAVMLQGEEEDRAIITRSMQPLKMLAAAAAGVPVDFSQFDADGILPLMKMFREA